MIELLTYGTPAVNRLVGDGPHLRFAAGARLARVIASDGPTEQSIIGSVVHYR